jgi:predicted permease
MLSSDAALEVFLAALFAVLRVLVYGAAGALLARKKILDRTGRKTLGSVLFHVLLPSLLFSKIGSALSVDRPDLLFSFLVCALFAVVVCVCGFILGRIVRFLLENEDKVLRLFPFGRRRRRYGILHDEAASDSSEGDRNTEANTGTVLDGASDSDSRSVSSDGSDSSSGPSSLRQRDRGTVGADGGLSATTPDAEMKGAVPRRIRVGMVAASAFGNSGALPLAIVSAIASAPQLRGDVDIEGRNGTLSESDLIARVEDHGIQFVSVYVSMMSTMMWGIGFSWMQLAADSANSSSAETSDDEKGTASADGDAPAAQSSFFETSDISVQRVGLALRRGVEEGEPTSIDGADADAFAADQGKWARFRRSYAGTVTRIEAAYVRTLPYKARFIISKIVSPPQVAIVLGVVFGLITPLRNAIFDVDATLSDTPNKAPFGFLGGAISQIGLATIPAAVFILGANVYEGPGESRLPKRLIAAVASVRLLFLPAIGVGLVQLAQAVGVIDPNDTVLKFVLMLEAAPPSALNLVLMCQLIGQGEKEMATLEFYQVSQPRSAPSPPPNPGLTLFRYDPRTSTRPAL